MSKVAITGNASGTGTLTIAAPNTNTDRTLTLPDEAGTIVTTASAANPLTSGTAVAATSGTAIDFTGIPSWVKRITVMLSGVSTNGTSIVQVQLGDSGGIETTGYSGVTVRPGGSNVYTSAYSSGILTQTGMVAASTYIGKIVFTNLSGNSWVVSGMTANATAPTNDSCFMCGAKTLSGTLDRVRITTVNGTNTFDAGSINILYE
jgi:hypothetical protein